MKDRVEIAKMARGFLNKNLVRGSAVAIEEIIEYELNEGFGLLKFAIGLLGDVVNQLFQAIMANKIVETDLISSFVDLIKMQDSSPNILGLETAQEGEDTVMTQEVSGSIPSLL